jgi:hypothetical protein
MDLTELRRIAAKEELSLNYVAKDEMISRALSALQGHDDLVLKGGTAINRAYLKNLRFSEDMDFDLIRGGNARQAIARTREIVEKLEGFEIAKPRIVRGTIRYDLYYINPMGQRDRIMLEFRVAGEASGYEKRIASFGFVPSEPALLNVYGIEELIRQKIACILSRMEGKDFFDLYHLLGLPHERIKIVDKKLLLKRMDLEEKAIKSVGNVLNHYIPRSKRPDWGEFLGALKERVREY